MQSVDTAAGTPVVCLIERPDEVTNVPDWTAPGWEELVREHRGRVYRHALRLTRNPHDAEDLTQETFIRVFRSIAGFTPGSIEAWMHRITVNLFLDQVRRQSRIRFDAMPDLAAHLPGKEPGPEGVATDGLFDPDIETALAALAPEFRAAVMLRDVEGMTYEEIAQHLDVRLGTVRSRIHRGRAALRRALRHREPHRAGGHPVGALATVGTVALAV